VKEWRLIIDGERSGNENMAVDEAMLIGCEHDLSPSTIRFYGWDVPTLSIGCFQKVRDYYDRCLLHGIPVVTRITGGRAVLHDMELTYSVVTNDAALFEKGINGAYRVISGILLAGLKELGFDAYLNSSRLKKNGSENCFDSASGNEIMINNRKVAGSAQKRLKNAFLQHGSIIMDVNRDRLSLVFGDENVSMMDGLNSCMNISRDTLMKTILKKFEEGLSIKFVHNGLTHFETDLKERLIKERYSYQDYLYGRR